MACVKREKERKKDREPGAGKAAGGAWEKREEDDKIFSYFDHKLFFKKKKPGINVMGKGFSRYATNATKTISISSTLQGKSGPILIILSQKDEIIFCMNVKCENI